MIRLVKIPQVKIRPAESTAPPGQLQLIAPPANSPPLLASDPASRIRQEDTTGTPAHCNNIDHGKGGHGFYEDGVNGFFEDAVTWRWIAPHPHRACAPTSSYKLLPAAKRRGQDCACQQQQQHHNTMSTVERAWILASPCNPTQISELPFIAADSTAASKAHRYQYQPTDSTRRTQPMQADGIERVTSLLIGAFG
jgi:hypothetical protein